MSKPATTYQQKCTDDLGRAVRHMQIAVALMNNSARSAYIGGLKHHTQLVDLHLKSLDILSSMEAGHRYATKRYDRSDS